MSTRSSSAALKPPDDAKCLDFGHWRCRATSHLDALDARTSSTEAWKPPSIQRVARLLQADPRDLAEADRAFVDKLVVEVPTLSCVRDRARSFAALVRKQGTGSPDDWLAATTGTQLEGFASGLRKDLAAVQAALEMCWSTGPVEGRNNRLKIIKRTMYGRADFDPRRPRTEA